MFDPATLALIGGAFLLGGAVKGVIGLGLPTVSLAALTAALGLQPAMALLVVPSFATNVWQAAAGGHARAVAARLWPLMAAAAVTAWIGAGALTRVDLSRLSALLGVLVAAYAAAGLAGIRFSVPGRSERWAGPLTGAVNGLFTGMTGSFVFPATLYLQAIGLDRDALIQAMGMVFTASTVALAVAIGGRGLISGELGLLSAASVLPALFGMALGRLVRRGIPQALFRKLFFSALLALGLHIVFGSLA